MHISPDEVIFWQSGFIDLNATIVYTWGINAGNDSWFKNHYKQTLHWSGTFPLAKYSGNYCHKYCETN